MASGCASPSRRPRGADFLFALKYFITRAVAQEHFSPKEMQVVPVLIVESVVRIAVARAGGYLQQPPGSNGAGHLAQAAF